MADRIAVRRRRRPTAGISVDAGLLRSMTAAAQILQPTVKEAPRPEQWHPEAWHYRDTTGELQHAERWLSNGLGRARLVAARQVAPGAEPEPLDESHPASKYMAQLAGGVGGQGALLRGFGPYLLTPGVGYLCGYHPQQPGGAATWQVRDSGEIRLSPTVRDQQNRLVYEVQQGDEAEDWLPLVGGIVCKVHRPDPRRYWRPDSPVRGALQNLKELSLLTQSIEATALSRLAGAGILPLPAEIEFEKGFKAFVQDLIKVFTTPIKNRASVAATVPFPIRVPGQWVDKIKPVQFHTLFDEHALKLRAEEIQRLGTAMDMPVRALTGEQENHWGKAATQDEGVQLHLVPNLELICDAITRGYLTPALVGEAAMRQRMEVPTDPGELALYSRGADVVDQDGQRIIAWYDLSNFTTKPDRSDDAKDAHDRLVISDEGYRQETGLSDLEAPEGEEFNRRIWVKVVEGSSDGPLVRMGLVKLGVVSEDELPPEPAPEVPAIGQGTEPGDDDGVEPAGEPTPRTEPDDDAPSAGPRALRPAATAEQVAAMLLSPRAEHDRHLAVVAAADALVHRALERAGNRLRSCTVKERAADPTLDQAPHLMHTACVALRHAPEAKLLEGAWDRLPEVAANLGADPAQLQEALSGYTRGLLTQGRVHTWELLDAFLRATSGPSPAQQVLALTSGRDDVVA